MRRLAWIAAAVALINGPAALAQASDPVPVSNVLDWFGADQYPAEALSRREEGRVTARILIDKMGKPIRCEIAATSGSAALDSGTCAIVLTRAFFQPAHDRGGNAVNGTVTIPVRWALPDSPPSGTMDAALAHHFEDVDTTVIIQVAANGTIASCVVSPPPPGLPAGEAGPCSPWPAGKKVLPALTRAGRPIGARIIQHFTYAVRFDP